MDASKASFMLLPDFYHKPGQAISLGRVLPLNHDTEVPDPDEPLDIRMPVPEDRISPQLIRPFEYDGETTANSNGGVDVDVSLLTGVGAGVKAGRGNTRGLKIKSGLVTRTTFKPTRDEMKALLETPVIANTLRLRARPSLYLITGLMVASGAHIEHKRGQDQTFGAHANMDLTAVQVPLNLGTNGERGRTTNEAIVTTIEGDFILAYQLVRMRKKLLGKVEHGIERQWALFDDAAQPRDEKSPADPLDEFDLEYLGIDDAQHAVEGS